MDSILTSHVADSIPLCYLYVFIKRNSAAASHSRNQEGYISGETLVSTDDPQEFIVISTWQSLEDWITWRDSKKRREIDSKIKAYQIKPTTYESYVFRKYRISVQKGFPKAEGRFAILGLAMDRALL